MDIIGLLEAREEILSQRDPVHFKARVFHSSGSFWKEFLDVSPKAIRDQEQNRQNKTRKKALKLE
jgi:hypothetical protein